MFSARFLLGLAHLNLLILVGRHSIASLHSHLTDLLPFLHACVDFHLFEFLLALEVLTEFVPHRLHTGALPHVHAKLGLLDLVPPLLRLHIVQVLFGPLVLLPVYSVVVFLLITKVILHT